MRFWCKIITFSVLSVLTSACFTSVFAGSLPQDIRFNTSGLTTAVSDIHFASHQTKIYAVWQGETASERRIYFQRFENNGQTWLAQETVVAQIPMAHQFEKIEISANQQRVFIFWVQVESPSNNRQIHVTVSADQGQTWQTYGVAGVSASVFAGADMAHDDDAGVCVVWASDQVYSKCSANAGQSWTAPVVVNNTASPISPYDIQREPAITAGGNGKFYVVWTDNRGATNGVDRYVYVTRSLDGGLTWRIDQNIKDQRIIDFANGDVSLKPDIVADKNGHVFVSWVNQKWWGQGETYRYWIRSASSQNSGATWNGVTASSSYAIAPKLLVDEDTGKFYTFWLNDTNHAYRKIQMSSSSDGAATWSPAITVGPHHDVQGTNYDVAVSNNVVAAVWENLEPWPGIYLNYSWNGGATWLPMEKRVDHPSSDETPITKPAVGVSQSGKVITAWEDERDARWDIYYNHDNVSLADLVRREADYILSCQYLGWDNAYGAINNVQGAPTYVVPRENGMAILGLLRAAEFLKDNIYREKAQLAADYLVRVQQLDGAWANQYYYDVVSNDNPAKSPTQTSEVMMALYHLGYQVNRYPAMKAGAQFLMLLQDPANKGGVDDGLIGGGKDSQGGFEKWRWASDNAYAYQALKAAYAWAITAGEKDFAQQCQNAAERILSGINTVLRNAPVWHTAVDEWGNPQGNPDLPDGYKHYPNWISYAPQMLDLPVIGVNTPEVGIWIASSFQQSDGAAVSYVWDDDYPQDKLRKRKSPGYSLQSALSWMDTGHESNVQRAVAWVLSSGLWDENNGGWVDWVDANSGTPAPSWQRFIDTSFYSIAVLTGGYDFNSHKALHLPVSYFMMDEQYYSGAAVAQMILHHMREGTGAEFLYQYNIVEHVRGTAQTTFDFTPDEMDLVLGHFDPYDNSVADQFDGYDSLPDGNPYQGYNFTVNSYDAFSDEHAMEKYLRDLAHWMAYPVTQRAWFLTPRELVLRPNTPAAVPLFGSYNHWAVVTGFKTSGNPAPDPHSNPFNTPAFTVYGFWLHDPSIGGIGRDTYKTADECAQNYFFPVTSSDRYNGLFVHVSEPPPVMSNEIAEIARPKPHVENLDAVLLQEKQEKGEALDGLVMMAAAASENSGPALPQSWRDLVDPVIVRDLNVVAAFEGKIRGKALFIEHIGDAAKSYYFVPYGTQKTKDFFVSGAILLDAQEGYFKEASWNGQEEILLRITQQDAGRLVLAEILKEYYKDMAAVVRQPIRYRLTLAMQVLRNYSERLRKLSKAEYDLVWRPSRLTPNPYHPMWRVRVGSDAYFVTQEGKIQSLDQISVRVPVVRIQELDVAPRVQRTISR